MRPGRLILAALLFAGCLPTLAELREQSPLYNGTVPGEYRRLATCTEARVYTDLDGGDEFRWVRLEDEARGIASLTGYFGGALAGGVGNPSPDLLFIRLDDRLVMVELRWGRRRERPARVWRDRLWRIVESCAGAPIMPGIYARQHHEA